MFLRPLCVRVMLIRSSCSHRTGMWTRQQTRHGVEKEVKNLVDINYTERGRENNTQTHKHTFKAHNDRQNARAEASNLKHFQQCEEVTENNAHSAHAHKQREEQHTHKYMHTHGHIHAHMIKHESHQEALSSMMRWSQRSRFILLTSM